jgi:transcriptional regulator with XRE-family HTH domain
MTTGRDLREAYLRHRWSRDAVARHFNITERTLNRWENRSQLPDTALPAVEKFIERLDSGDLAGPALRDATDTQLLAEVADRLARRLKGKPSDVPGPSARPTDDLREEAIRAEIESGTDGLSSAGGLSSADGP